MFSLFFRNCSKRAPRRYYRCITLCRLELYATNFVVLKLLGICVCVRQLGSHTTQTTTFKNQNNVETHNNWMLPFIRCASSIQFSYYVQINFCLLNVSECVAAFETPHTTSQ